MSASRRRRSRQQPHGCTSRYFAIFSPSVGAPGGPEHAATRVAGMPPNAARWRVRAADEVVACYRVALSATDARNSGSCTVSRCPVPGPARASEGARMPLSTPGKGGAPRVRKRTSSTRQVRARTVAHCARQPAATDHYPSRTRPPHRLRRSTKSFRRPAFRSIQHVAEAFRSGGQRHVELMRHRSTHRLFVGGLLSLSEFPRWRTLGDPVRTREHVHVVFVDDPECRIEG